MINYGSEIVNKYSDAMESFKHSYLIVFSNKNISNIIIEIKMIKNLNNNINK